MLAAGFDQHEMVCIVENLFQDGDWAILEWRDPLGLRGCGFFKISNDRIVVTGIVPPTKMNVFLRERRKAGSEKSDV